MPNRSSLGIPKSSNEIEETEVKFFSPRSLFLYLDRFHVVFETNEKLEFFFHLSLPVKFFGRCFRIVGGL